MKEIDEDALICDMAETYGIYDPEALPVLSYARYAAGLRSDSRIKMKMSGNKEKSSTLLLALILDTLRFAFTSEEDRDKIKSVYELLNSDGEEQTTNSKGRMVFDSPDDFERAWAGE